MKGFWVVLTIFSMWFLISFAQEVDVCYKQFLQTQAQVDLVGMYYNMFNTGVLAFFIGICLYMYKESTVEVEINNLYEESPSDPA